MGKKIVVTHGVAAEVDETAEDMAQRAIDEAEFAKPKVPDSVPAWKAQIVLHKAGILNQVESALNAEDKEAQIRWQKTATIRRDHPLLKKVAAKLKLTEKQVDDLFLQASELT